ncbi:hypothetical protein [Nannocystis bainbridge]|uniref:Uncharacterized protein n=1 Tax=Nannocystis bainbridge TaxID=2995303 RepID=A0ABT5E9J9_9BACT|nr:hypothetical protein [Nannocystis bainbridge]MDC0721441.1 hypothetical protein [Nannocystis bainbridge]
MSRTISHLFTVFAFSAAASMATPAHALIDLCPLLGIGCGEDDGDDDIDLGLGECFDIDLDLGADCIVIDDLDELVCDPVSVAEACLVQLGPGPDIHDFADCLGDMVALCEAEIEDGGALFCDGLFVGADACLLGLIDLDIDIDIDLFPDVDLVPDLEFDECTDLGFDLETDCEVQEGLDCLAQCDPIAVEPACSVQLDFNDDLHLFAFCAAELMSDCLEACVTGGALFCDGDIYVGPSSCL